MTTYVETQNIGVIMLKYKDIVEVGFSDITYRFRFDPVPYISKCNWHMGSFIRHPKYISELRMYNEHVEYVRIRSARKPNYAFREWVDETCKSIYKDRGWKSQNKASRQWKSHLKRHEDIIHIVEYCEL